MTSKTEIIFENDECRGEQGYKASAAHGLLFVCVCVYFFVVVDRFQYKQTGGDYRLLKQVKWFV